MLSVCTSIIYWYFYLKKILRWYTDVKSLSDCIMQFSRGINIWEIWVQFPAAVFTAQQANQSSRQCLCKRKIKKWSCPDYHIIKSCCPSRKEKSVNLQCVLDEDYCNLQAEALKLEIVQGNNQETIMSFMHTDEWVRNVPDHICICSVGGDELCVYEGVCVSIWRPYTVIDFRLHGDVDNCRNLCCVGLSNACKIFTWWMFCGCIWKRQLVCASWVAECEFNNAYCVCGCCIVIFSCNSIDGIVFTLKKNLVLILRELAHMIVSQT